MHHLSIHVDVELEYKRAQVSFVESFNVGLSTRRTIIKQ